jgi:hypothetical protein
MNVSTRPQRTATPVTATTTVTTTSEPAQENPSATSPTQGARDLFASTADALRMASLTDEPHLYSGASDRLLRIAADIASAAADEGLTGDDAEHRAFDIAAVVHAARWVPADSCSQEREVLIERAGKLLNVLAATDDALQLGGSAVRADTQLNASGLHGLSLAQRCTWDIEPLCRHLVEISWGLPIDDGDPGLVRAAAVRINSLNSVLMSYLGEDSITLGEAHSKVYGGLEPLDLGDAA